MSDEVKQAAERFAAERSMRIKILAEVARVAGLLDDMIADRDKRGVKSVPERLKCIVRSAMRVGAVEDEVQTAKENATPLTAEILQASGWYFSEPLAGYTHIDIEFALHGPYEVFSPAWHAYAIEREFGTIETVGDLRKLLEALHIPAVVVVPKGGE